MWVWPGCAFNSCGFSPFPNTLSVAWRTDTQRQGIERLQRKKQRRERRGSWKSVKETFGGDFSLNWFNPFSGPRHPKPLSDRDWVRQVSSVSDTENTETTTEEPSEEPKDEDFAEVVDE